MRVGRPPGAVGRHRSPTPTTRHRRESVRNATVLCTRSSLTSTPSTSGRLRGPGAHVAVAADVHTGHKSTAARARTARSSPIHDRADASRVADDTRAGSSKRSTSPVPGKRVRDQVLNRDRPPRGSPRRCAEGTWCWHSRGWSRPCRASVVPSPAPSPWRLLTCGRHVEEGKESCVRVGGEAAVGRFLGGTDDRECTVGVERDLGQRTTPLREHSFARVSPRAEPRGRSGRQRKTSPAAATGTSCGRLPMPVRLWGRARASEAATRARTIRTALTCARSGRVCCEPESFRPRSPCRVAAARCVVTSPWTPAASATLVCRGRTKRG